MQEKTSCKTCLKPENFEEKFEPLEGFEPPSITNYAIALLLSYSGLCLIFNV